MGWDRVRAARAPRGGDRRELRILRLSIGFYIFVDVLFAKK